MLPIGTVVGVNVFAYGLWFHHLGVIVDHNPYGEPLVVSKSKEHGRVVAESLRKFSGGRQVTVHPELRGALGAFTVADRALDRLGEPWSIGENCEHFVREVQGLPSASPQLQLAVTGLGVLATLGLFVVGTTGRR